MKIITRYLFAQIWVPALLSAGVVAFLVTAGAIRENIALLFLEVPFAQLRFLDIAMIAGFSLPSTLNYVLPITFMFGIMFAFGKLAGNSELTALRASGIGLSQLVASVLVFGAGLSVLCFSLQNVAQPWSMKRLSDLITRDVPLRMTIDLLPVGVMHEFGGWQVYVGGRGESGTLKDLMMLQPEPDGGATTFYAESARIESADGATRIVMEHGHYIPNTDGGEVRRVTFSSLSKTIPRYTPADSVNVRQALTIGELIASERNYAARYAETNALPVLAELRKDRIEIGQRFSMPLMCLAAAALAAPLGARTPRAGRSYAFAAGAIIVAVYFTLVNLSQPLFVPTLGVAVAMSQIPNVVLGTLGAVALWRVDRV